LSQDYFDRAGCLLGDPVADFDRMRSRARLVPGVVVYKDAEEWSEHLAHQRLSRRRKEEILRAMQGARIPGIRGELYPYQLEGAAFLAAGGRGLLADDMGLGKTLQAIAGAQILRNRDELRRALVLCPASLKSQWAAEILRFTGETAMIVDGGPAERLEQYRARRPFTISNYELALRDGQAIAELAPDLLIVDEAQRIRNWRTRTAEAIKTIRTPFAFVLTGTPLQNRLDDLYSVMQVVDRRVLGPLWAFNEQFMIRTEDRGRIEGYKNLDELRRRLAPVLLRRDKSDVMRQLPERIDTRRLTPLTARQRELMEEGVATAAKLAATARRRNLLPKEQERLFKAMQRARMACNAAGLVDKESIGSPKLDELEQLLSDLCLDEGRKVVVFSEWERFCRMAAQRAEKLGIPHVRLHGRVPSAQRGALIERFREDPDCRVFFSTDAGGVGLNLQFAGTLINLDLPWNPAVLEQRIGRVHRHGQQERVHVLLLIAEDSFESGLERTLGSKRQLFDAALDPRSEEISVHAPASCLETVRQALGESDTEAGDSIESQEGDAPREAHSPLTAGQERPTAAGPPHLEGLDEPLAHLAACLGPRLGKAFRLASGQLVALVDRVDDITRAAARKAGVALMETSALDGLAALGADSPFATAQLLLDQEGFQDALGSARRAEWQALARRKLSAARLLAAGGQGSESMAQVQAGMIAALKSLIVEEGHWALPTLRLVHEVLVPAGRLDLEQAAAIARAMALAAAYVDSPQAAPAALVEGVIADAERLLDGCLRDGNVNPPTEPTLLVRSSMAGARSSLPPSGK
jgi:superfamily II DNA or RNA helicase